MGERQLTPQEFSEFMQLSSELSWEEFSNGGGVEWDAERYRQVEREMYELRQQKKADTLEYFKLIKERSILEQSKLKNTQNKDMETGHSDIETTYAKGGKILGKVIQENGVEKLVHDQSQRFGRIGINDAYTIEAINEIGLQGVNFDEKSITNRINAQLEYLLSNYDEYVISEDSEAITYDIKNEIQRKTLEGEPLDIISALERDITSQSARNKRIEDLAKGQKESLMIWVDYLKQSEYSVAFKCVMFTAVLKYNYELKTNKLYERDNKTIRNFTPFDAGVLAQLYQSNSNYLLLDYSMLMNEQSQLVLNSREVIDESRNGKWIKFNGGKSTSSSIQFDNAKQLTKLVQNTYWCTKTNAKSQLAGGDFYVYVTQTGTEIFPRIAVRMEENKVGEVRGNRSQLQDLEDEMLPIAEDFLIKNIPNDSGVRWLDSIRFNKKCIELRERIESEGFFKDFIYEYIKSVGEGKLFNTDYGKNGNLQKLESVVKSKINTLPNEHFAVGDIATSITELNRKTKYFFGDLNDYDLQKVKGVYGVDTDLNKWELLAISGNIDASLMSNLGKLKVIGSNLYCGSQITSFGKNLTYVGGNLFFNQTSISTLENIEYVGGSLTIDKSDETKEMPLNSLGKLKAVNGALTLINCDEKFDLGQVEHIRGVLKIKGGNLDLKNIKRIDGSLILIDTAITDLKKLEYIGSDFNIAGTNVKIFESLKFIGGNADFSNNFSSSTQNIEIILGSVRFLNSRIMDFPNLRKIGGNIDLKGSFFKSFGNIRYIGGNLDLSTSKVEDLSNLQYVGGYINFKSSKIATLNNLKKIVKFANFEDSNVLDLASLETVGGNAYFNKSKVQSLGNLNYIGGFAQFDNRKDLEKEWLERSKK